MHNLSDYYDNHPILWNFLYPFFGENSGENAKERVLDSVINNDINIRPGKNALYLHIPFCDTICSFCPFIKSTKYEPVIGEYVDALIEEMKMISASPTIQKMKFDVVFVGGGTPSVLTPELIYKLSTAIKENFTLSEDYEWTFECEAKTASEERIIAMVEGGANRGSFGVQTLNPKYRKMFNLTATFDQIQQTIHSMKKHFDLFNLDLLYQLPGQTEKELLDDLNAVTNLGTTSIDFYPLEYIACSKGWLRKITNGKIPTPPLSLDKIKYNDIVYKYLKEKNWSQKYVYTFMPPEYSDARFKYGEIIYGGYEDQCIGLGTGAITYMQGITWANDGNTSSYIKSIQNKTLPIVRSRNYHAYDRKFVFFPKTMEIEKSYLDTIPENDEIFNKLNNLLKRGLVKEKNGIYYLEEHARPWYPSILVDLLPESERNYYNQSVEGLQKELNWFEPTEVVSK
ncbi:MULTISPECIES: coproporphyrinogen-III oxidase family protein [Cytobacillus]|uniref:Heme chaperone HemW n=1 Tax=Cytobacillus kochii TaxID=859143 RepID=A0A248TPW6_9BACI|nr:radical SAM protein [Cytobacillus kochii]ASV70185.1 coproporphyrinogen III oxidase [Cytobacillus kochii]MDQ0186620.1 oxygen-independent coproporphyrinogen-3 oxidase [Cytobacillus kochii]